MPSMTLSHLRGYLQDKPDYFTVVIAHDAEGNGFSILTDYEVVQYDANNDEIINKEEAEDMGIEYKPNAIVLWS